jgi:tetratricopeptide (TPR) repeat protein
MISGEGINGENESELQEFEVKMKSLVDEGKYSEAIEFSENNRIRNYHGDSCTLYSYKIMGVCYSNDIRNTWKEEGYKPSKWMAAGDRLFDKGDYSGAVTAYGKARAVDSDKAWYAMGCAYRAMGNPYESVEAWDEATGILMKDNNAKKLESDPNDAPTWAERGNIDYNQENWGSAISSYNNSLAIDPNQPKIWFRNGCSHFEKDQYQEALAAFKKVLELKPDHATAANDAAVALWKLGQYQLVKEYLDLAARHCPPGSIEYGMIEGNKKTASLKSRKGKILTFLS